MIRDSGVGAVIAEAMVETSLPAILLPFLIATIIRFIQGSGTVAMITAASITAPIIANMSVNPVFAALAACVGSLFYSYFNDSFFWGAIARSASRRAGSSCGSTRWPARSPGPSASSSC